MEVDYYLYHQISTEDDFWGDAVCKPEDLLEASKDLKAGDTLNIYVNSPGGDVYAGVTITSIIQRLEMQGITVNAYIDGLAASAASFVVMACTNIYAYKSATLMIHKPWSYARGNANDLRKEAETLEKIEKTSNMPLYTAKAKITEQEIADMMTAETWLGSDEMSEKFNIEIIDSIKAVEKFDSKYFSHYKHAPSQLIKQKKPTKPKNIIDYGAYRAQIDKKMEVN